MKPSYKLSQYFTYGEAIFSQTAARLGIDNTPGPEALARIKETATRMDEVRLALGVPVIVSSWYRCLALNRAIGSKDSSSHTRGEAVDFKAPQFGTPSEIFSFFMRGRVIVGYDQLILEYPKSATGGWVHISFTPDPRQQAFVIDQNGPRAYA